MGFDRRIFLKTLGVAGVTLTMGKSFGATTNKKSAIEFYGILCDTTLCIGCQGCEYACAEQYGLPEPVDEPAPGVVRKTDETRRVVVNCHDTSKGEQYMRS